MERGKLAVLALRRSKQIMNPIRRAIHQVMRWTRLDSRVDPHQINAWLERRHARRFPVLDAAGGNDWIASVIHRGEPAALCKLGSSECWALAWHLRLNRFYKYTWTSPAFGDLDLAEQSGVFPRTPALFHRCCETLLERLQLVDGCAVWHNIGESRILQRFSPSVMRLDLQSLEPYFFPQPWSAALAGKRVLVVHPFKETIQRQFARRSEVWAGRNVLPEFEIDVIRAPYGFSKTDFSDWLEMLRWLETQVEQRIRDRRIDVALLACGAAGLPLAAKVKQLGGIGIHLGGATQILFGIRGGRWDKNQKFCEFFNDSWVRPSANETPSEAHTVDQGGYW